jgi:hypothetical protein
MHDPQILLQAPPEQLGVRRGHQDAGTADGLGGHDQRFEVLILSPTAWAKKARSVA